MGGSKLVAVALLAAAPLQVGGCGGAGMAPSAKSAGARREAPGEPPVAGGKPAAAEASAERKIIYTATVEVVVKNLAEGAARVRQVIDASKGYVAKSDVAEEPGLRRTATYTLRVPADKYQSVLDELFRLGDVTRNAADSQDVTEEFFDLQARLRNLRSEEEALNKLMREKAANVEDVLKIRAQLVDVRGNIERADGRTKYLSAMTSLSTIFLTVREVKDYVSPTAPTFGGRLGTTFEESATALWDAVKAVALMLTALVPWLPVILLGLFGVSRLGRLLPRPTRPARRVVARPLVEPVSEGEAAPE